MSTRPTVRRLNGTGVLLVLAAQVLALVAAHLAGRVFEHGFPNWPILVGFAASAIVAIGSLAFDVRAWGSWALEAVIVGLVGVLAAGAVGGAAADAVRAPTDGVRLVLQARWPAPLAPASVALISMLAVTAFVATGEIVRTRRLQVAALAPAVSLLAVLALLGAPAGAPSALLLATFVVLSVLVLWLARRQSAPSSAPIARGAVLGVTAAVLGAAIVPFLAGRGAAADRFDPRTNDAVDRIEQELSPLARLDEWRSRQPATTLFTATGPAFERWTLVDLPRYDGQSWMPAADFRPTGKQLAAGRAPANVQRVAVELGDLGGHWLPTPGDVVASSRAVSVDARRSGLLVPGGLVAGETVTLDVVPRVPDQAQLATASAGVHTSVLVDATAVPSSIAELASRAVQGATSDYERALRIEQFLKTNYELDPSALPGHTLGLLRLFLEDTHRGRDEQFVAAYGLLANAVGLPVRIAVGFVPAPSGNGLTTITSAEAQAWPEVSFGSFGWVRFDPVPAVETPPTGRPANDSSGQARPAPAQTPPVPRTSPPTDSSVPEAPPRTVGTASPLPVGVKVGVGALALVLLVAAYVFGVLMLKRRRRRRLRLAGRPERRVTGAFAAGLDLLIDLGLDATPSATDAELVGAGRTVLVAEASDRVAKHLLARPQPSSPPDETAQEPGGTIDQPRDVLVRIERLDGLAAGSTAAVYDDAGVDDDEADVAWQQVHELEREIALSVGPLRWLRSRLSLRSLRKGLPADPRVR